MSSKKELIKVKINELFKDNSEKVSSIVSNSIGIKLIQGSFKVKLPSKIGGCPDTNIDFEWPYYEGIPLHFLCQINLNDLRNFNLELPSEGILYFFVAPTSSENYHQLKNAIKVIYVSSIKESARLEKIGTQPINENQIDFFEHFTLPSYQEKRRLDLQIDASDNFDELEEYISELTYGEAYAIKHHILGDPDALQGSVRIYWGADQLYPDDIYYEKITSSLDKAVEIGEDFVLLLQLDLQDELISLPQYGDSCLYFGILRKDLKLMDFSNVKLVIQNT